MKDKQLIERIISEKSGQPFRIESTRSLGGGCINDAMQLSNGTRSYFIKANRLSFLKSFEDESSALQEIHQTHTVRVPEPIAAIEGETQAYLVLEFIETRTSRSGDWACLGQQLAALHAIKQDHFGWSRDNLIGATPQPNPKSDDWIDFFRTHRLEHQFRLCREKGFQLRDSEALLNKLPEFFSSHIPHPSLLHGDLWSGNAAFDADGNPFLFDPATYYGDREADLAFTEFFGGFGSDFYRAYDEALPLDPGYEIRKTLYNLYHCLNHVYLFGSGYASQAQGMAAELLRS